MIAHRLRTMLTVGLILGVVAVEAKPPASQASASSRFSLRDGRFDPAAEGEGRFRIAARFAAEETSGELRERGRWTMLGRLAKAGASCDASAVFRDGFEGP